MIRLSGRLRSAVVIGVQGIRARKLRTLLSMVSLFLGVLAVVVVQASAEAANRAATANVELTNGKVGTRTAWLPPDGPALGIALDTLRDRAGAMVMIGGQTIIGEPRVRPVNPRAQPFDNPVTDIGTPVICDLQGCYPVEVSLQPIGRAVEFRLAALTSDIRQFRPFVLESGEWLDFTSEPSLAPRLVLNREAAKGLRRHQVPAEMRVDGASVNPTPRIIGVVDDGMPEPIAYVRADEMLNWIPSSVLALGGMQVMLEPSVAGDLERILRSRLAAGGVDAGMVQFQTVETGQRLDPQLRVLGWIFFGLAVLVLLIGVAGILNVGLATVGERVEEFALRRAVGTPRALLAGIVLAETLITGLLTAGAAIGVAAFGLRFPQGRLPIPLDSAFPWQAGVAGVVAGLVAGLLGGLIPAVRAARIPIATVMRA